jgi:putative ABC transport system permease protein
MVSLARKNLLEDIPRFLVAQAGIMFAVSLVTIQTGIFNGFTRSTAQLIYNSNADLWVTSDTLVQPELSLPLPATTLNQAQEVAGVARAEALIFKSAVWRHSDSEINLVRVVGFDPQGQLFTPKNLIQGSANTLQQPYTAIADTSTMRSLNIKQVGDRAELGSLPVRVVGLTQGNRSITSNPFVFASLENANAYATGGQNARLSCKLQAGSEDIQCTSTPTNQQQSPQAVPRKLAAADTISFILIRAQSGQDLQQLKQKLEAAIPNTTTYTQAELIQKTQRFWQQRTGVGFILGLGAAVGIIVGGIIVGQILYSSVSDHLREFGTLKAMGASDWTIYGVIIEQSLWMAVLGYIPGIVLCFGVGAWTFATQGITILITPATAIAVFGITVAICIGSAVFAIQKVTRVDPAIVFKA